MRFRGGFNALPKVQVLMVEWSQQQLRSILHFLTSLCHNHNHMNVPGIYLGVNPPGKPQNQLFSQVYQHFFVVTAAIKFPGTPKPWTQLFKINAPAAVSPTSATYQPHTRHASASRNLMRTLIHFECIRLYGIGRNCSSFIWYSLLTGYLSWTVRDQNECSDFNSRAHCRFGGLRVQILQN